jgi:hypothetical protein
VLALIGLAHTGAVAVNLHRYIGGADGPWFAAVPDAWRPPLPAMLIVTIVAACWIATTVLVARLARTLPEDEPDQPDVGAAYVR